MSPRRSLRGASVLVLAGWALAGCVYFNAYYNAQRLYSDAEADRRAGRLVLAEARYDSVVEKARESYRRDPDGSWADDALFLRGRAELRRGELIEAREALEAALEITDDRAIELGSTLYLGAIALLEGDRATGVQQLNDAIRQLPPGPLLAEGHLFRARHFLRSGYFSSGWWDLDRAAETDPSLEVQTDLERIVFGVMGEDSTRVRLGVERILARDQSYVRSDTLSRLVERVSEQWGPLTAVELLGPLDQSGWPPMERDQLRLLRGRLLLTAGDTAAAFLEARTIADGTGPAAVEARLLLALLTLAEAEDVRDLDRVRPILLPAAGDPDVFQLLEAVRKVELLTRPQGDRYGPLRFFAAAELTRDALSAPRLARRLFLDFSLANEIDPLSGKAALAALELSSTPDEENVVRSHLTTIAMNPYVRASRTGWFPASDFTRIEEELRSGLRRIGEAVSEEASERDVLIRTDTILAREVDSTKPKDGIR